MENKARHQKLKAFFAKKIYLTPEEAHREIYKRWHDVDLKKKVRAFLKDDLPPMFDKSPKAILARAVASPNHEFFEFCRLAREAQLEAWYLEYNEDKFRAENFDKYYLGKMVFHHGVGKKGGEKRDVLKIVDFDLAEGKTIKNIPTLWGGNLVDFHHDVFARSSQTTYYADCSDWIRRQGGKGSEFYTSYLALFVCFGVLFENFLLEDEQLIDEMFIPAYERLQKEFGLSPIVVPLSSFEREYDEYWRYYPGNLSDEALKISQSFPERNKIFGSNVVE
ncbi:MAG: hypothetical protein KBD65_01095 [Candidatus Moranbacteria bacterium]|nr:hypothetical protein [Candidatus Moranbacteria bacterium]